LEEFYASHNSKWEKEQVTELAEKTQLSYYSVWKWNWEQEKRKKRQPVKPIFHIENQMWEESSSSQSQTMHIFSVKK
jgi:hypothetical protein